MVAGADSQGAAIIRPAVCRDDDIAAGGIALVTNVGQILASEPLFTRLTGQLGDALGRQLPVSLLLSGLAGENASSKLAALCRRLAEALDAPGTHTSMLEITIRGQEPLPELAWGIRCEYLGEGGLNIICDEHSVSSQVFWSQLWRLRSEPRISTALWPLVRSPCPLLTSECADNLVPQMALQAPSESAWVSASLTLPGFIDANGELDDKALATALIDIVVRLDSMHDAVRWPTAAMQHDAWMNRRLALRLDGLGDYAMQCGLDPGDHETLQVLREILLRVRRVLRQQSRAIASATELLPAIGLNNPVRQLGAGPARDCWEQRWFHAVERVRVRHRNMLVLSPWSLFPSGNADSRYSDLMPLLRLADACVFREKPPLADWNLNEFKRFHQRIWALTRQLEADALVAEQLSNRIPFTIPGEEGAS